MAAVSYQSSVVSENPYPSPYAASGDGREYATRSAKHREGNAGARGVRSQCLIDAYTVFTVFAVYLRCCDRTASSSASGVRSQCLIDAYTVFAVSRFFAVFCRWRLYSVVKVQSGRADSRPYEWSPRQEIKRRTAPAVYGESRTANMPSLRVRLGRKLSVAPHLLSLAKPDAQKRVPTAFASVAFRREMLRVCKLSQSIELAFSFVD